MTPDQLTIVVEFLVQGLNLPRVDNLITIREVGGNAELSGWNINQGQPTQLQMEAAFTSPAFTSYLTNRPAILARNEAKRELDGRNRILIKALLRELSARRAYDTAIRKAFNDATGATPTLLFADLKQRILALPAPQDLDINQLKLLMDSET